MVGKLKDILVTVMKVSGEEIVKVCGRGSCFLKETERERAKLLSCFRLVIKFGPLKCALYSFR